MRARLSRLWERLKPRKHPGPLLWVYGLALLLTVSFLFTLEKEPQAVAVLAPSAPAGEEAPLFPEPFITVGKKIWLAVLRWAWPLLPREEPLFEGSFSPRRLLSWAFPAFVHAGARVPEPVHDWPFTQESPGGGPLDRYGAQPVILIYHTHATESFYSETGSTKDPFSQDERKSVVRVGDELARELWKRGIPVFHDRTFYDMEGRLGSYEKSLEGVAPLWQEEKSVMILLDIHRDSAPRSQTTLVKGEETLARVLFVVGSDQSLPHPRWRENAQLASRLAEALQQREPGLVRPFDQQMIMVAKGRYNQHLSPNALLLEVGGVENTMEEALKTARILAAFLADALQQGFFPPRTP
ncbi:MAG: stage II sporulation protein P [Bacillota bacterium]|nr:stage II sporulation protein P [Bacillota bacterium]